MTFEIEKTFEVGDLRNRELELCVMRAKIFLRGFCNDRQIGRVSASDVNLPGDR
jgi:hypothetical protein